VLASKPDFIKVYLQYSEEYEQRHGNPLFADRSALSEAIALDSLEVFSKGELLRMWCDTSARTIFPTRKIGALREGYEASFLVLEGNPIADFNRIRSIQRRFKQGEFIHL
jgi:imidazolonepropionase-like amidohydrolase